MARITITDDKLYEKLVDYCKINSMKIGDYCTKLLREAFNSELYDDVPFGVPTSADEPEPEVKEEPKQETLKQIDVWVEGRTIFEQDVKPEPVKEEEVEVKEETKKEPENIIRKRNKRRL